MILQHRNLFWMLFLGCIAICAFLYTAYAFFSLFQYQRLNRTLGPQQIQWSVIKAGEDAFVPTAQYQFKFKGKEYEGQTKWKQSYLNAWAASEAITRLEKQSLPVWIDDSSPSFSTMEKVFPWKISLYTFMLWGMIGYLIWIDRYRMRYPY